MMLWEKILHKMWSLLNPTRRSLTVSGQVVNLMMFRGHCRGSQLSYLGWSFAHVTASKLNGSLSQNLYIFCCFHFIWFCMDFAFIDVCISVKNGLVKTQSRKWEQIISKVTGYCGENLPWSALDRREFDVGREVTACPGERRAFGKIVVQETEWIRKNFLCQFPTYVQMHTTRFNAQLFLWYE